MSNMSGKALLALGSNRAHDGLSGPALLSEAVRQIDAAHLFVSARSSVWESPPWPPDHDTTRGQANYFNAIVACEVGDRAPDDVVAILQMIERKFGRTRRVRWEARTLDLDLIDLDGRVGDFNDVILPHPHAHERAFVLSPLAEVAPGWRHPILGKTAAQLLSDLPGQEETCRIAALA